MEAEAEAIKAWCLIFELFGYRLRQYPRHTEVGGRQSRRFDEVGGSAGISELLEVSEVAYDTPLPCFQVRHHNIRHYAVYGIFLSNGFRNNMSLIQP